MVAPGAAFHLYRCVFVDEWTGKVTVALQASRLVRANGLNGFRQECSVRIVAVDARHGALREFVDERPLEAGPNVLVA